MSWEKFKNVVFFFSNFNEDIDEKIVRRLGKVYFIEFVNFSNLYEPNVISSNRFSKSIDLLPHHIKSIILSDGFNCPVQNLPIKLKELVFGQNFNQEVNNLPPGLIKLIFGSNFNKSIENLPNKIKILSLGKAFTKSLDYLPCSITHLEINNSKINLDNLPSSLNYLILGYTGSAFYSGYFSGCEKNIYIEDNFKSINPNTKILVSQKSNYLANKKIRF